MTSNDKNASAAHDKRALLYPLIAITAALVWILWPFFGAILWGFIIALLSTPLNRWLIRRFNFRSTPAALLTMLVCCWWWCCHSC